MTLREGEASGAAAPVFRGPIDELEGLLRWPTAFFAARLAQPPSPRALLLTRVAPFAAVRPLAVLVRSVVGGAPLPGLVVGLGSLALLVGTWLGTALVIPALARQFHSAISDRQAFALTTYASLPVWLAGALYAVPEEPEFLFLWSRLVVLWVALYGLFLARQAGVAIGVRRSMQMPLVGGIAVAVVLIYGLLFVLLGVSSHVVLFFLG